MWKYFLQKCGVLLHSGLQREWIPRKQCMGIVHSGTGEIPEGTLLAAIPVTSCPSPALLEKSSWRAICSELPEYEITSTLSSLPHHSSSVAQKEKEIRFECGEASLQALFHLALTSCLPTPEGNYIRFIMGEFTNEKASFSVSSMHNPSILRPFDKEIKQLERMKLEMLIDLHRRFHPQLRDPPLDLKCLKMANTLCESRCVEVSCAGIDGAPYQDFFGGPAFVPFLDLINHDDKVTNVEVCLTPSPLLRKWCPTIPETEGGVRREDIDDRKHPYYVVVYASAVIGAQEELSYAYVDKEDLLYYSPVYWASRFHFVPPAVLDATNKA